MGISKDGSSDAVVVIAALPVPVRPVWDKILPGPKIHRIMKIVGGARKPEGRRHEHV